MDDMDKTKTSCDLNGHKKINAMYAGIVSRKVSRLNFPEATYFEILYFDASENEWHCGFGSFTLCFVEDWLKAEFEPTYKRLDIAITDLLARVHELETLHRTEMCESGYDCVELGKVRKELEEAEARAEKAEREIYRLRDIMWQKGIIPFPPDD